MKIKLFCTYVLIAVLTIVSAEIVFWTKGYQFIDSQSTTHSLEQAQLLSDIYVEGDFVDQEKSQSFVDQYGEKYGIRITIIDRSGMVIADSGSRAKSMENHKDREEFVKALGGESYTTRRKSHTLGLGYDYTAVPLETKDFSGALRVAVPLTALNELNVELAKQVILSLGICFLLVLGVSAWLTTKEDKPDKKESSVTILPFIDKDFRRGMDDTLQIDSILINRTKRSVSIDGEPVALSKKEFELLCLLAENRGRVFSREVLLEKIWGYEYYGETRTVDVHIRNLRKKIERDSEHPNYVITVRGYGYKFC